MTGITLKLSFVNIKGDHTDCLNAECNLHQQTRVSVKAMRYVTFSSASKISSSLVHKEENKNPFNINQKHTEQPLATDVTQILPSCLLLQINGCGRQCSNYSLQKRLSFSSVDKHGKK